MKRRVLFFLSVLFFILSFVFSVVLIGQSTGEQPAGFVGSEACKDCHEAQYNKYVKSVHGKRAVAGNPANRDGCESCHGPGAQHVEKGGGRGVAIFVFGRTTDANRRSAKCLSCHEESKLLAFWNMNKHKFAGNACDSCHSIHSSMEKKALLKVAEPDLCFNCHKDIRGQIRKQSHHPLNEQFVGRQALRCSTCHNVMGAFGSSPVDSFSTRIGTGTDKMLRADSVNELCFKCHAEKRGPFMWEHPPVEENCLICHEAHGSNHRKLLVSKVPLLCQNCHANEVLHPSRPYTNLHSFTGPATSGKNKFFGRSCLNCHTNIHGSNGPGPRGQSFVR